MQQSRAPLRAAVSSDNIIRLLPAWQMFLADVYALLGTQFSVKQPVCAIYLRMYDAQGLLIAMHFGHLCCSAHVAPGRMHALHIFVNYSLDHSVGRSAAYMSLHSTPKYKGAIYDHEQHLSETMYS